jgi:hypothetical protein
MPFVQAGAIPAGRCPFTCAPAVDAANARQSARQAIRVAVIKVLQPEE